LPRHKAAVPAHALWRLISRFTVAFAVSRSLQCSRYVTDVHGSWTCTVQPQPGQSIANGRQLIRSLALVPAVFTTIAHAVHPVEVRGQDFVDTVTNKRLMIIGVDYQPGGQASYKPSEGKDVLNDADVCLRDAVLMQRLGVGFPL
jgi:hypothetical protein